MSWERRAHYISLNWRVMNNHFLRGSSRVNNYVVLADRCHDILGHPRVPECHGVARRAGLLYFIAYLVSIVCMNLTGPGSFETGDTVALCSDPGVPQFRLGENDNPPISELEVGARVGNVDLAEQRAGGVPDVDTVSQPSVDITLGVGVYAVGHARGRERKELLRTNRAVLLHRETIDGRGEAPVHARVPQRSPRVRDIKPFPVGGEAQSVRAQKGVGDGLYYASGRVETVHLPGDVDRSSEVLDVPVVWVCEVDPAGVDGDVVQRVELAAVIVVNQDCER